jgi:Fe-S cluster assembly scaffold protein SufB
MPKMSQIKKADFHLIDKTIKNINQPPGVVLLPSSLAWEKYPWTRKYFGQKPILGYFLWVKKSQRKPLSSCMALETAGFEQKLNNLVVLESKVKTKLLALCLALREKVAGSHLGQSKIIIQENSSLEILHQHSWGQKDVVFPEISFFVKKKGYLDYLYKNLSSPKRLKIKSQFFLEEEAKVNSKIIIDSQTNKVEVREALFLKKKDSGGTLVLRLVGRKGSQIKTFSRIIGQGAGRGHLDCQGLLIDKKTSISLTPQIVNQNDQALITHEASIGKIEKEKLEYLQSRGLTEKQAIDLIVKGFLGGDKK